MVDLPSQPLAALDPAFEQIALETAALTFGLPALTTREKLLVNFANDICRAHFGLAFRLHIQAALAHGVPFADLLAVVRFLGPYAGYPAAADALDRLSAIAAALGVDLRAAAEHAEASSVRDQEREPDDGFGTPDAWLAGFITSRTGQAWAESGLSARECAYLALAADVAQQTLGPSFRAHVGHARATGATPEQLRDLIRFLAECGIARSAAAFRALEAVLADQAA